MGFWESGILGKWDFGKVGFWEKGILRKWELVIWNFGIVGIEKVGFWESGILKNLEFEKLS